MRSKEVEEAIKYCNLLLAGDITVHIRNEYGETEYAGDVDKQYNEDLKTVLEYIEELEKITNEVDKQFIHKDRIYELTEEMNKQADSYNKAVDKFNKLLEE